MTSVKIAICDAVTALLLGGIAIVGSDARSLATDPSGAIAFYGQDHAETPAPLEVAARASR